MLSGYRRLTWDGVRLRGARVTHDTPYSCFASSLPDRVRQCEITVVRAARDVQVDAVTIGVVLLAIVNGAGGQLGVQLWEGVVSLALMIHA